LDKTVIEKNAEWLVASGLVKEEVTDGRTDKCEVLTEDII